MKTNPLYIGLDVGSTTVKAVVIDVASDTILWNDYQRHDTKQPEKVLEFLQRIESELHESAASFRIFITGSGGSGLAKFIGAKFVQEVNAVSLAVEKMYPNTGSVIELGGQDAKIIIFKEDEQTGKKKKIPSMNDKCAGGTGAVIDKINAKMKIPSDELCRQGYTGIKLHPVAGKCGVFAETDINGLQKQGVPADELMASLFESIIQQNLSVLTRGHTLRPEVLLLGGPNTFIKGMVDCWKHNIPKIWEERNYPLPEGIPPEELIKVPENAQYFAAIGAVEFGKEEEPNVGWYAGAAALEEYITVGRVQEKQQKGGRGLYETDDELDRFKVKYRHKKFMQAKLAPGTTFKAFLGIDGGSTSTKAALIDQEKNVAFKSYQLSKGNPIEDMIEVIGNLQAMVEAQGAKLEILGVGTTGYAKDILKDTIGGDVALVETVAHTQAALHFYKHVDVICDVGGQDIKIIILNNGRVVDFKLNTQCSAGNGYFLQSTAQTFGYPVEEFADMAFSAKAFPKFGYGCAVFMQSDIVDFQRQGWRAEEIMAGLANVLPKNIWLYVSQIPNLAKLGSTFVLQGGTQYNLAAVKSQVDFIESRFKGKGVAPNIIVHEHCGEAGAIGCAVEAARLYALGTRTTFIGLERVAAIRFTTSRNEDTRCYFCKNKCLRTFIDVETTNLPAQVEFDTHQYKQGAEQVRAIRTESSEERKKFTSKIPLAEGAQRLIIATCEKGTVEDVSDMRVIAKGVESVKKSNPNVVEFAAKEAWRSFTPEHASSIALHHFRKNKVSFDVILGEAKNLWKRSRPGILRQLASPKESSEQHVDSRRESILGRRKNITIGIPRVLNMYAHTPFVTAYFESLGIPYANFVFSDFTTEELFKAGSKRGSIDPCFPSKVSISHVHNLLYVQHKKKKLDWIFFPMIDDMPTELHGTVASKACPTVVATPETVKAAFIKEGNLFEKFGITFLNPFINLRDRKLAARQLFEAFGASLGLTDAENDFAVAQGYEALAQFATNIRVKARAALDQLEREDRIGIVVLARPYHNDPGLNHEILEEFQKLGYPVFSQDSLPIDTDILDRLFGDEVRRGVIADPMDISDVWKNSYSENTSKKVWAAKYTARHPNLVALELSNFKCGHDAPIYTVVEEIVQNSGTPYFSFKDIDENKPTGSIKIRVETISYFLKRFRDDMITQKKNRLLVEEKMKDYEAKLRKALMHQEHQHRYNLPMEADQEPIPISAVKLPELTEAE